MVMTDSLLSRLQNLTEPSREIDAEIALANGWTYEKSWWQGPKIKNRTGPPRYTESIDAAMTLVPVVDKPRHALWINLHSTIGSYGTSGCTWSAEIWGVIPVEGGDPTELKDFKYWGLHSLPAIALLIAIIKAKEESKP
jgi:hypothetical protein